MKSKIYYLFIFLCFISTGMFAQSSTSWKGNPNIHLEGYLDVFYAYDFNKPESVQRQSFFYNHNRHSEFNINQGVIGIGVEHPKYRARIALHAGTYPNDNYSAEPGLLKNIYEAYVGVSLNRNNNLWLDAGVFGSHLGFESALSMDNWTLTRSLSAESSPFFLSGVKLSYLLSEKLELAALVVNGWQRIQKVRGNSLPSFGTQIIFRPKTECTLNWSTFVGTDDPNATRRMRYFSNLYGQFQCTDKLGFIAGFDIGMQQDSKGSSSYDTWYALTAILYYELTEIWSAAFRAEYFQDRSGVIIQDYLPEAFKTSGLSFNVDYQPATYIACRFETRWLNSAEELFEKNGNSTRNNAFIVASIAFKFRKELK